jgi:hypothetical protein
MASTGEENTSQIFILHDRYWHSPQSSPEIWDPLPLLTSLYPLLQAHRCKIIKVSSPSAGSRALSCPNQDKTCVFLHHPSGSRHATLIHLLVRTLGSKHRQACYNPMLSMWPASDNTIPCGRLFARVWHHIV